MSELDLGPARYWKEGPVIFAENDFMRMAYVATDHPSDIDGVGVENELFVTYVSRDVYAMLELRVGQSIDEGKPK